MIPLVDTHCHLCAGLDDGPRTEEEALEMCRIAWEDGTRWIAATAHQNDRWPDVTPERIIASIERLAARLRAADLPLALRPTAEVMVGPDTLVDWSDGKLLGVANQRKYILVEFPHQVFVDIRELVARLREHGIRPILAHPERHPELLHDGGRIEQLIQIGCLVQISSASVASPNSREDERALKRWLKGGVVHLLGSDGHSPHRRRPLLADAYHRIGEWAGVNVADRIGSTNGLAVLDGRPLKVSKPEFARRRWFSFVR